MHINISVYLINSLFHLLSSDIKGIQVWERYFNAFRSILRKSVLLKKKCLFVLHSLWFLTTKNNNKPNLHLWWFHYKLLNAYDRFAHLRYRNEEYSWVFCYLWDNIFIGIYPLCFNIPWCEQQVMYVIFTSWKIPNVWS